MRRLWIVCVLVVVAASAVDAQRWWRNSRPAKASNPLSTPRRADWNLAGASDIAESRAVCYTDTGGFDTAAQINTQIAGCATDGIVQLQAGTYNLSAGLLINRSDVTLKGAGANQTILNFSGSQSCNGAGSSICVSNGYIELNSTTPTNATSWSAGYSKGTSTITLVSVSNLSVGSLLVLYQDNAADDPGAGVEWTCSEAGANACAYGGYGGGGCTSACDGASLPRREQLQFTRVTAINGTNVSISPAIIANNWQSALNPKAAYLSAAPISGVGIEDISVTHCSGCDYGVALMYARNSWVKGIKSKTANRNHVELFECLQCSVVDSYLYESVSHGSTSYGVECIMGSSNLIQNNIATDITTAFIMSGSCAGSVIAYNYSRDNTYVATNWQQMDTYFHGAGTTHVLMEGNIGIGVISENIHGPSSHQTVFRSYYRGREWNDDCNGGACTAQTNPIHLYSYSRFWNVIGSVFGVGDASYHVKYESYPSSTANCYLSIFQLAFGDNQCASYNSGGTVIANDTSVRDTMMRWGNYDVVSGSVQWNAGEVPAAITGAYDTPVPTSHLLVSSLYLSSKPSWFGSKTWPPIGPDVSGGDMVGLGGHVYTTPAKACYDAATFSGTEITDFNRASCY